MASVWSHTPTPLPHQQSATEKREVIIEGDIARYKTYEKLAPTAL